MAMIPQCADTEGGEEGNSKKGKFQIALVTNSTQVRIINEKFSCSVLEGHKDIVLAVDATPDG
jgi:hypothetical protein